MMVSIIGIMLHQMDGLVYRAVKNTGLVIFEPPVARANQPQNAAD